MSVRRFASVVLTLLVAAPGCSSDCPASYFPAFSVHVVDAKTHADLAGATLTFEHAGVFTASTDDHGNYDAPYSVDSGQWAVTVVANGYRPQRLAFQVQSDRCQNRGPDLTVSLALSP